MKRNVELVFGKQTIPCLCGRLFYSFIFTYIEKFCKRKRERAGEGGGGGRELFAKRSGLFAELSPGNFTT